MIENFERYDFYKYENTLKKGTKKFLELIDAAFDKGGIDEVINILKSSGLAVNIFNNEKRRKQFQEVNQYLLDKVTESEAKKINDLLLDSRLIENVFESFMNEREEFFKEFEQISDEFKVSAYLIALEIYLSSLKNNKIEENILNIPFDIATDDINTREALFDSATESTGMILKYFKYKKYAFKNDNIKKKIPSKTLQSSCYHIFYSEFYTNIHDLLEYWQYSEVDITSETEGEICFEIKDEEFELNNSVSNERFLNLRQTWQMDSISKIILNDESDEKESLRQINKELDYAFGVLYFGDPLLEYKIKDIKLKDWIRAYRLLANEADRFLTERTKITSYNLDKVCMTKSVIQWEKFFLKNNFSEVHTKEIIKAFTFDNTSQDLLDCPFIKFEDYLVLVPSLVVDSDPPRALASNFLNRDINLAFRGDGFENKIRRFLTLNNINNTNLYKKTDEEYECDIVFEFKGDLYFIECKAHVQPFSPRQHANHLHKLHDETYQINRIADFYEGNIDLVNEKLCLDKDFIPNKVHRILLTTSMVGSPIYINNVHIVDESSFIKFIDRNPPSLKYMEKQKITEIPSNKFDLYNGELSNEKFEQYLNYPPQIRITQDLYSKLEKDLGAIKIKRYFKTNRTMHVGINLSDQEKVVINNNFKDISF